MKILDTVGIDISKLSFDVRIHSTQSYRQFKNTKKGFKKLIEWVYKNSSTSKDNILFVFEYTGIYSDGLSFFLSENNIPFSPIPGLAIKRSLGIVRGKDDKVDATKIALYAYRLRDEIKPYKIPTKQLIALKRLLSLRDRIVKQRAGYKVSLKEQKQFLVVKENQVLFNSQEKIIKCLTKQIEAIEKQIGQIIEEDENLKEQHSLITSIKGVGNQTAYFIIAYTNAFTKFKTSRQFASYIGIAPFPNSSGTSLNGKTKVNHLANKKLKSLIDLCAKVAIQYNPELKEYYNKRIEKGKNKMSTINIIRNKLISRIFAVIERGSPYIDTMKYAA